MTIAVATELGAGYGHATQVGMVVNCLHELGKPALVVAKDVTAVRAVLGYPPGCDVLQAPFRYKPLARFARVNSYADILVEAGFGDVEGLAARLRAWISLYERYGVSHLILDHAPTALFAAHAVGIRSGAVTSSFAIPPLRHPFPVMSSAHATSPELRSQREQALLGILSQALQRVGLKPPQTLQEPFERLSTALANYRELDHYGAREGVHYLGTAPHSARTPAQWPAGEGTKLFLYAPWHPAIRDALAELLPQGYRISAVIPDAPPDAIAPAHNLSLSRALVDIRSALTQCEVFVGHGSLHSVTASLLGGTPCVMIPLWQEQGMFAERVVDLGAGLIARPETVVTAVSTVLGDRPRYAAAAAAFAGRYSGFDCTAAHRDFLRQFIQSS